MKTILLIACFILAYANSMAGLSPSPDNTDPTVYGPEARIQNEVATSAHAGEVLQLQVIAPFKTFLTDNATLCCAIALLVSGVLWLFFGFSIATLASAKIRKTDPRVAKKKRKVVKRPAPDVSPGFSGSFIPAGI